MKSSAASLPYLLFFATLGYGFVLSEVPQNSASVPFLVVFAALALVCQQRLGTPRFFALDRKIRQAADERDEVFYKGSEYKVEVQEELEQKYLDQVFNVKKQFSIRTCYAVLAGLFLFFVFQVPAFHLSLTTFLQFVAVLSLVSIVSIRHYILPLIFSFVAVNVSFFRGDEANAGTTFVFAVYIFLLFATCLTLPLRPERKGVAFSRSVKPLVQLTALFIALYTFFCVITPDIHKAPRQSRARLSSRVQSSGMGRTNPTLAGHPGGSPSGQGHQVSQGSSGNSGARGAGSGGAGSSGDDVDEPQMAPPQKAQAMQSVISLIKMIFFGLLLIFLIGSYLKWRKKKNAAIFEESLSPEIKAYLVNELKKIEQMNLSLKERVIKKYFLFLKIMEAVKNPKPESLPPLDYLEQIKMKFPVQQNSLTLLTVIFSETFYGNLEVPKDRYIQYDSAFRAVFKSLLAA